MTTDLAPPAPNPSRSSASKMNLSALRSFAPAVRLQLMEAVTRKLDYVLTADTADLRAMSAQREALRKEAEKNRKELIERVAYIWFNRFVALRYLDAHGWHPFGARVITPVPGETQPELLRKVRQGQLPPELEPHADLNRVNRLLDGGLPSPNPQAEVYRHLILAACRFYHALLPVLFEKLDDETELLLPDDLLTEHSVVDGFRTAISDVDCAEVEIIGWLYQFYISEKKDTVMARRSAVPKEDIPAVTQLFTPHWIVRYLVENSLGRLWLLNRPQSRLREKMSYYIEGDAETDFLKITRPEEIKLIDPAAGSGHMLTYAFDLLYAIYEEEGYAPSDIPSLILKHNLYGVEICDRAATLAALALVLKARSRDRRFFSRNVQPHVIALQDVRFEENELAEYFKALNLDPSTLGPQPSSFPSLLHQFEEAKNFGSLIQPCMSEAEIQAAGSAIRDSEVELQNSSGQLFLRETHGKVLRVLEQGEALTQRYHAVVANPPYMGRDVFNTSLKAFVKSRIPEGAIDLYGCFIARNLAYLLKSGYCGMITIPNWMFLPSFGDLREAIYQTASIRSLIHNGRGVWGSDFGSCSFVIQKGSLNLSGVYKRLFILQGEVNPNEVLIKRFHDNTTFPFHSASTNEFKHIPNKPVAYWISPALRRAFANRKLVNYAESGGRCKTSNDEIYLRFIWEVDAGEVGVAGAWCPMFKGGEYRKYFGNLYHVMRWTSEAKQYYRTVGGLTQERFWNESGITWTIVSASAQASFRHKVSGSQYNSVSPTLFFNRKEDELFFLGLLNSKPVNVLLQVMNPTLALNVGDLLNLPIPAIDLNDLGLRQRNEELLWSARINWDNSETSWDFREHPLLRPHLKVTRLETSWRKWETHCSAAIRRMQELETENNRLFIEAYGLQDELSPEVPEEQITLARADQRTDMAAFLSYAVGCMMGRYSLDKPGLILADAGATLQDYLAKVPNPTFMPDEDGIVPVLDGEWFADDIVARTREFLRVTFGEATLNENIRFIEEALGKDLRKYFLTDFYKNHISNERAYGYKKRPIYWLFRSPKGGFAALVYLHRMTRDTPNQILNRYLRDYLKKLQARIEHLDHVQATSDSAREKTAARKESDKLKKTLRECEDWERDVLLPLAQSRPALDLDDGVKVNYLKLGEALAPIAGLAKKGGE